MRQLPLGVRLRDAARLDGFVPGPNLEAWSAVAAAASAASRSVLWLWGRGGSGKTHLLQAGCAAAAERGAATACLDLANADDPRLLEGWDRFELVALDDLDAVSSRPQWNAALFRLHTLLLEAGGNLLLSSTAAPAGLAFPLADLRSRLLAASVLQLHELDEAQQVEALRRRAARRGLELSEEGALYLVHRCPRDMHTLCGILDRLDEASLAERRRLTLPFLRRALDPRGGSGSGR